MFKKVVAIASVAALLTATTPAAFAHGYEHGGYGHGGYRHDGGHGGGNGAFIALGALAAFAVGAAVLSSTQQAAPPVVYAPPPAYYPPPAYGYAPPAYYAPAPTGYGQ